MKAFRDFLYKMGCLHDAILSCFTWIPDEKKVKLCFEDIYSNFEGLPEYPGPQSGEIILHGVTDLIMSLDVREGIRVFDFLFDEKEEDVLIITFFPAGRIRIRFVSADYPLCQLIATG